MGNGWHEWPLVLFTVLGQCVVGALIVSGLGWLAMKDDAAARQRLVRSMFFLWLVMGLGFWRQSCTGVADAGIQLPQSHWRIRVEQ